MPNDDNFKDFTTLYEQKAAKKINILYRIVLVQDYDSWRIFVLLLIVINYVHATYSHIFLGNSLPLLSYYTILLSDLIYCLDFILAVVVFFWKNAQLRMEKPPRTKKILIFDAFLALPLSFLYEIIFGNSESIVFMLLRSILFFRLFHILLLFYQKDNSAGINHWKYFVAKYFLYIFLMQHTLACIWYLVGHPIGSAKPVGWAANLKLSTSWDWYIACIYFAMINTTTCGFGNFLPVTALERIICIFAMCLGFMLTIGVLIGTLSSQFINTWNRRAVLRIQLTDIKRYLKAIKMDKNGVQQIIRYYEILWCKKKGVKQVADMQLLPFPLLTEICFDVNLRLLNCSLIFKDKPEPFLRSIAYMMKHEFYQLGDIIFHRNVVKNKMVFVASGAIEILSEEDNESTLISFGAGTCLGEAALILSLPSRVVVRAAVYTELQILDRKDFVKIIHLYPGVYEEIRSTILERIEMAAMDDHLQNVTHTGMNLYVSQEQESSSAIKRLKDGSSKYLSYRLARNTRRIIEEGTRLCFSVKYPWILQPNTSLVNLWEIVVMLSIILVATLYPYYVTFHKTFPDWLITLSAYIEVVYVIDIYIILTTGIIGKDHTIKTFSGILRYRMTTIGFYLDVMSSFYIEVFAYTSMDRDRLYYVLKLNRLLKAYRIFRLFHRLENVLRMPIFTLRVIKYPLILLLSGFWFGSLLYLVTCYDDICTIDGWFYVQLMEDVKSKPEDPCTQHPFIVSVYFAVMALSGLGYGDIVAKNAIDIMMVYLMVTIGVLLFGYCAAELSATITHQSQARTQFQNKLYAVIKFMDDKKIQKLTKERVINFFILQWYHDKAMSLSKESLFFNANTKIQDDVLIAERLECMLKVPLFELANKDFIQIIATKSKTLLLPPNETLMYTGENTRELYIVQGGYCKQYSGDKIVLYGPNSYFGIGNILVGLPSLVTVKTITHVKLIRISDELFRSTVSVIPEVAKELSDIAATYNISAIQEEFAQLDIQYETEVTEQLIDMKESSFLYVPSYCRKLDTRYGDAFTGFQKVLKYLLLPICILPNGLFIKLWVYFRVLIALCIALVTPYEQIQSPYSPVLSMFLFCLDFITYIDLYLMMLVGYYGDNNQLIVHPLKMAMHYVTRTFVIDAIICFPWQIIVIFLFPDHDEGHSKYSHTLNPHFFHCVFKMIRVLQVYRLSQVFDYMKKDITRKGEIIEVLKFVPFTIIVINIWSAMVVETTCNVYSIHDLSGSIIDGEYAKPPHMARHKYGEYTQFCMEDSWIDRSKYNNYETAFDTYLLAFYWCTSTLVGCGFGDISGQHSFQLLFVIGIVICGILFFGFIYASISSHNGSLDNSLSKNQESIKDMKRFMYKENVDAQNQRDILDYFEYLWRRTKGTETNKILRNLHTSLHGDVVLDMYESILKDVPLFEGVQKSFFRVIGREILESYFRRREIIFRAHDVIESIFIIYRGKVEVLASNSDTPLYMGIGGIFGNLTSEAKTKIQIQIIALGNVDALRIQTETFYGILKKYPNIKNKLDSRLHMGLDYLIPSRFIDGNEDNFEEDGNRQDEADRDSETRAGFQESRVRYMSQQRDSLEYISSHSKMHDFQTNLLGFVLIFLPQKWFRVALFPDAMAFEFFNLLRMIAASCNFILVTFEFSFQYNHDNVIYVALIIDLIFWYKIFLNMHKAYENRYGDYVINNKKILKHFLMDPQRYYDLVANLPIAYLAFLLPLFTNANAGFWFSVLRLITLFRFVYIMDFYKERSSKLTANVLALKISAIIIWLVMIMHIFACIWYLLACPIQFCFDRSWATVSIDHTKHSIEEMYIVCIYFIVNVLSTTGSGDIVPDNKVEIVYVTLIMMLTKFIIGIFIGDVMGVFSLYTASIDNYESGIIELRDYFQNENVSKHQLDKMWSYVKQLWIRSGGKQTPSLVQELPYSKRCDLLTKIYGHHLRESYLFSDLEESFIRQLCDFLYPTTFFPGNYIVQKGDSDQTMYFIHRGEVDILTVHSNLTETVHDVLKSGEMFGIVQGLLKGIPHRFSFRAKTVVEIVGLRLNQWSSLLKFFPGIKDVVYKRANEAYNKF